MPTYVCLMTFTDQGVRMVKEAPKRVQEAVKRLEAMGGRLHAFYATMGEYDYVGIADVPNDEVAMAFLLGLSATGNVRTKTLKAFPIEQFAQVVKRLP